MERMEVWSNGLDIMNCSVGDWGCKVIASAWMTATNKLTHLFLDGNQIGQSGAEVIANALSTNFTLTDLSLTFNKIGDRGAEAIASALSTNCTLSTLGLAENEIGDPGAEALASALSTTCPLTSLFLAENKIGNRGTLQTLWLDNNQIE